MIFGSLCKNLSVPIGGRIVYSFGGKRFPQKFHGLNPLGR